MKFIMKHKKIIIALITILILVLLFVILSNVLVFNKKEEKFKDKIIELTDDYMNGISISELNKKYNINNIDSQYIMMGKDSYPSLRLNDEDITSNNLDEYKKLQEELVINLEKTIKDSFKFKYEEYKKDTSELEEDAVIYDVEITNMYYFMFVTDLKLLQDKFASKYIDDNTSDKDKDIINYKAKVVALKVLSDNINDYKNTTKDYSIGKVYFYKNDEERSNNSLLSYFSMLEGANYTNTEECNKLSLTREDRLNKYIENAINNNVLKDNYLQI